MCTSVCFVLKLLKLVNFWALKFMCVSFKIIFKKLSIEQITTKSSSHVVSLFNFFRLTLRTCRPVYLRRLPVKPEGTILHIYCLALHTKINFRLERKVSRNSCLELIQFSSQVLNPHLNSLLMSHLSSELICFLI